MVQFSVVQGLRDAVSAYKKHAVVLLAMGILLSGSMVLRMVVPAMVAKKLGVYIEVIPEKANLGSISTDKAQMVIVKLQEISTKIMVHLHTSPKLSLILILLAWMLFGFVVAHFFLAGKRVALGIVDSNKASMDQFFERERLLTWVGALALLILYGGAVVVGGILISAPVYMLLKSLVGMNGAAIFEICWNIGLLIAFLFWLAGYIFLPFVIIENDKMTVRDVLYASMSLAKGNRRELVWALLAGWTVIVLVGHALMRLLALIPMEGMMTVPYAGYMVVVALLAPVWFVYVAEIYRAFKKAK